jgi:hypothetical protein
MTVIGCSDWLQAWEAGAGMAAPARALGLLQAACPHAEGRQLAGLTLGRRDAMLLDLRQALFGKSIACTTNCPACAVRLELEFDCDQVRVRSGGTASQQLLVACGPYRVRFRLPTAGDLVKVAACADVGSARGALIESCITEASHDGLALAAGQIPEEVLHAVMEHMAAADPQAATGIAQHCPSCGHDWESDFDIAGYLWLELDAWARRLLLDVHSLAKAYGWTEPDVVALSPSRRHAYLEMIGQ